jgi:hypothetical protein
MEYHRDPKNQIYADLAYRLGKIIVQYENLNLVEEKYEATLYVAVLQNLMANCNEYVREMTKSERKDSVFKKDIELAGWGLNRGCWIKNTFKEEFNLQNFITRIRNSVSHPTSIDISSTYPSSGFTTLPDDTGRITKFRFVNSPDTRNNRVKSFDEIQCVSDYIKQNKNEFPDDITYKTREVEGRLQYVLSSKSQEFARISIIDLSVKELGSFVKHLSNYLAQPIQKDWDGLTVTELLVA